MDLKMLHSIMNRKKFYHFEGKTNDGENNLYISFSIGHNGRGDYVNIRIGDIDNDIDCKINTTDINLKNVDDNTVFRLIENQC